MNLNAFKACSLCIFCSTLVLRDYPGNLINLEWPAVLRN
jgi:hypothetical protein